MAGNGLGYHETLGQTLPGIAWRVVTTWSDYSESTMTRETFQPQIDMYSYFGCSAGLHVLKRVTDIQIFLLMCT